MHILYTAQATAGGGRDGHARSADGVLDVDLSTPRELGGPGKRATNPEQLFAAGYAACFDNAVRHVAKQRKRPITESSVTATVGIGPRDDGSFGLSVALAVSLSGVAREAAEHLIAEAHRVCPYSNATRGNINVEISIRETAAVA